VGEELLVARALLVYNPVASRAHPKAVRAICGVFTRRGWLVDVAGTTHPGHADELAREGVEAGVDVLAVYGGDGTLMQVVRAAVGHEIPVGVIPGGTGNLLAGNLRLPKKPEVAAEVVVGGVSRCIDLGRVERNSGLHYFAVACGDGLDATLMAGTSEQAKRRWGMAAYVRTLWGTLAHLQPVAHRVTVDGTTLHTEAVTVLVANCGEIIPGLLRLREGIAFDDGLLDVVIMRADSALKGIGVLSRLLVGRTDGTSAIRYSRGRSITVETDDPLPVEMDGEQAGETPVTVEVAAGAISVMVPRDG
jgi:YegS/Rv2252/BmrU family lipid kinase